LKSEIIALIISLMINVFLILRLTKECKLSDKLMKMCLRREGRIVRKDALINFYKNRVSELEEDFRGLQEINQEVASEAYKNDLEAKHE
jgi:CRISPR/Cas system-associated protein Csm6